MSHVAARLQELELEATLPPSGPPPRTRHSLAAALRLSEAMKPIPAERLAEASREILPRRVRCIRLEDVHHEALWSPLQSLDPRDGVRTRISAYCEYVRIFITTRAVAEAVGTSERHAHQHLFALRQRGKLRVAGEIRGSTGPGRGGRRMIWEWVGDA